LDKKSKIYRLDLDKDMFTVNASNKLLVTKQAIDNIILVSPKRVKQLNDNLNRLALILKRKNITLMFMPVVDKYDLYSSHVINNTLPTSDFFKDLRPLKKEYYLVDTKQILSPYLSTTKDIFYADDTHWSPIASEIIIKNIPFDNFFNQ
jgi:hypothetical protein